MTTLPQAAADVADLRGLLQRAGLRVTAPRLAVLHALAEHPHSDADALFRRGARELPTPSVQAVSVVLGTLSTAGIVRKIEPAGFAALYELRVGDNHHHLVCRSCHRVLDVDCTVGAAPCLTPAPDHGFDVGEAEVTFWGTCPGCRPDTSHDPTREDPDNRPR